VKCFVTQSLLAGAELCSCRQIVIKNESQLAFTITRRFRDSMHIKAAWEKRVRNPFQFFDVSKIERWVFEKRKPCLELVGDNWRDESSTLPIAIFWGFNPWKRGYTSAFFREYRCAFVYGKSTWRRVHENLSYFPEGSRFVFMSWSYKAPKAARRYAEKNGCDFFYVEDGFVRSFNPGALHTKAFSLSLDRAGPYFDASCATDLESLLNARAYAGDETLLQSAEAGIALARAAKISKYYSLTDLDKPEPLNRKAERERMQKTAGVYYRKPGSDYVILVLGQVEDDASIRYGCKRRISNLGLVKAAREEFPDAEIYFRPHPDVLCGNRRERSWRRAISNLCTIIDHKLPLHNLFAEVDHVYTTTSLAGLEALFHGKKVTTLGTAFYSGWGMTCDGERQSRREARHDIRSLFAAAYLLYPRYIHPISNEPTDYFDLISYFIVEKLKYFDSNAIPSHVIDLEAVRPHVARLSAPLRLLLHLNTFADKGAARIDGIMAILTEKFRLADFGQAVFLLARAAQYDALKAYCDYCNAHLAENGSRYDRQWELLTNYFYYFGMALKSANGRVLADVPDLNAMLVQEETPVELIVNYVRCLSRNLHYGCVESVFERIEASDMRLNADLLQKICDVLVKKPSRSERNGARRHYLLVRFGSLYKSALAQSYPSEEEVFINAALHGIVLENDKMALDAYSGLRGYTGLADDEADIPAEAKQKMARFGRRAGHLGKIADFLAKRGHFSKAERLIALMEGHFDSSFINGLRLDLLAARSRPTEFIQVYAALEKKEQIEQKKLLGYAAALRARGELETARAIYSGYRERQATPEKRNAIEMEISKLDFLIRASEILNACPQPQVPKGVVLIASQTCYNTLAMMIPALVELKKKGYAVVNLTEGMVKTESTGIDYIDQFANCIPARMYREYISHDWIIDWPHKRIEAEGINFYQGFYERLSTSARTYFPNLNHVEVYKNFHLHIARSDLCLEICEKVFTALIRRNLPVIMVSGNSHVTPFSVIRDYCRQKNHPLLSFINCNLAYENYFSNLGSKYAHTMCVTDMTLYPDTRAPFLPRRDQFEPWYDMNKNSGIYLKQTQNLFTINRGNTNDEDENKLIAYLHQQKTQGKKILCVFGKVPVDLGVPYDGGPAHEDMADWLNHTIQCCAGRSDIVLLVKPHPHELRPEVALDLVDRFTDLISVDLADNVRILGHREINAHALAPYLDLAVLYNGSSGLELTAQGVPVIMCAHFGRHDYPVDLIYPESREQYEAFLTGGVYPKPSEELRKKAAFLISYMGTDEITIFNDYSFRGVTNDSMGVPRWKEENVKRFLSEGDPLMRLVADRMVEKFEGKPKAQTATHPLDQALLAVNIAASAVQNRPEDEPEADTGDILLADIDGLDGFVCPMEDAA